MFVRSQLKQNAKKNIHQNLSICIATCLIAGLLLYDLFGIQIDVNSGESFFRVGLGSYAEISLDFIYLPISHAVAGLVSLFSLAYIIFVKNPIQVGYSYFFIENRQQPSRFEVLFSMFKKGIYGNVVKIMLLRDIYQFLWTLLFIIPGIYKAYQYSMIPYILAENPEMDSTDVFELTKILTKDAKLDLFILDLSFILWAFGIVFTCGLLSLYTTPYIQATCCEAYIFLRDKAISEGNIEPIQTESEEVEYVEPTNENLY